MSYEELSKRLKGRLATGKPLSDYTSFGLGGPAKLLVHPADEKDLEIILGFTRQEGMKVLVLGAGTNLLVRDSGFPGLVIRMAEGFTGICPTQEGLEVEVGIEAKTVLDYCLSEELQGIEFSAGIPGSVGGMIKTNAGAFGGEMGSVVAKIKGINRDGEWLEIGADGLSFGYRNSNIPEDFVITRAWLRLKKGKREELKRVVSENLRAKATTQPISQKSAGCIFKNPPQVPAAKLIEEVGGRGMRVGEAMVSPLHANFIVNLGGATASQALLLIDQLRKKVRKAFGLTLELEVKVVGGDDG